MVVLLPPWVMTTSTRGMMLVLWEPDLAPHIVGEFKLVGARPLRHNEAMRSLRQLFDQPTHEIDVGRAERPEGQVDKRAVTTQSLRNGERLFRGAHR